MKRTAVIDQGFGKPIVVTSSGYDPEARPGHGAIARELQTMLTIKYQEAKKIVLLADKPEGTFQQIGKRDDERKGPGQKRRPMSQAEAKRIVDAAIERIRLIDA